jgi:hypothetical protein
MESTRSDTVQRFASNPGRLRKNGSEWLDKVRERKMLKAKGVEF